MRGIPSARLTQTDRERFAVRKLEKAKLLLFKIRDELDPERFTVREIQQEFEDTCGPTIDNGFGIVLSAKKHLPLLEEAGFIVRISRGVYRITEVGMEVSEATDEEDELGFLSEECNE